MTEPEHVAADGTVRKDHYGSGRQPWDDIVEAGWGPQFAAGNVLKYLRRTKDVEDSRRKAQWYWVELKKMVAEDQYYAVQALRQLDGTYLSPANLTSVELRFLENSAP